MHPLLQKQEELHTEGAELLKKVLLPILSEFGEVTVGGSYEYHLLSYHDIDIDIISDDASDTMYEELCEKITSLESVSEFKTLNRADRPLTHPRPKGYWLAPKIQYGENLWNIDIWFQKPEWHTGNTLKYKEALQNISDEKRIAILTLKEELMKNELYGVGKEFQSVDVYEAVLHGDVDAIDTLREYKLTHTPS